MVGRWSKGKDVSLRILKKFFHALLLGPFPKKLFWHLLSPKLTWGLMIWSRSPKSGPGPVSVFGPVVSPGSNLGSGSVSDANAPTDILASEMKRDPAFALAVSSLERCLRVRERVGSSLIVCRPGKLPGSGSFDAAVCEKESKGLVSDSLEVTRDRGETEFKGTISSGASDACVHRGATMVTASSASVACKDPRVSSGGAETAHVSAVDTCDIDEGIDDVRLLHGDCRGSGRAGTARATAGEKGIIGLLEEPESVCSKDLAESTATEGWVIIHEFIVVSRVSLRIRLVCHLMHVSHTLMRCLLLLLVHLLPSLLHVELHHFLLLLGWACMKMAHLCMMHVPIRGRTRVG